MAFVPRTLESPQEEQVASRPVGRVVLMTGHYYGSKRRAGFHWLADAYWRAGYDVIVVTTQISWLSWLRRDRRFAYPIFREAGRFVHRRERFRTFVWFTPWHPANLRFGLANRLTSGVVKRYGRLSLGALETELRQADIILFESDLGLFLVPRIRELAPEARFVYRVSDDLRLLKNHPTLLQIEMEYAPLFDVVSTPSRFLHARFAHLPAAALHHHGLEKALFDHAASNPYQVGTKNAVYVGTFNFDYDYIRRAVRLLPEIRFHVIGPIPDLPRAANLTAYGELPFRDTISYLKFADVGLQLREYTFGAESFTDSLKMQQYTYCRLPIVAPDFLRSGRTNLFLYKPGDDTTIRQSMIESLAFDRTRVDVSGIHSWDELARILTSDVHPH